MDVPDGVLGIGMYQHSDFAKAELIWEVSVVVGMPIGIDTRHDRSNNISILGGCNGSEEDVSAITGREEHIFLSLEAKVQKVALAELKDRGVSRPNRLCNWNSRIKTGDIEFQNLPQ